MRDSLETNDSKKDRPAYRSDAGRVVYGGGGITPDVIVADDTLTTAEQQLVRALAPKSQEFYTVVQDYALELSKTVRPDFQILPAWREELRRRLQERSVPIDSQQWTGGSRWISRQLDFAVTRYALGDSAWVRRDLQNDPELRKAIEMMNKGQTQKELFNLAQTAARSVNGPTAPRNQNAARP